MPAAGQLGRSPLLETSNPSQLSAHAAILTLALPACCLSAVSSSPSRASGCTWLARTLQAVHAAAGCFQPDARRHLRSCYLLMCSNCCWEIQVDLCNHTKRQRCFKHVIMVLSTMHRNWFDAHPTAPWYAFCKAIHPSRHQSLRCPRKPAIAAPSFLHRTLDSRQPWDANLCNGNGLWGIHGSCHSQVATASQKLGKHISLVLSCYIG